MTDILKKYRFLWLLIAASLALLIGYKVIAQSTTVPVIDFDNGPLVAKNQPSNIVLALSVEFPTSGGAYKDASYIDGKEYLGYFNSRRCYTYPGYGNVPRTGAFDANSDYFTPTGETNSSFYCNVAGSGTGFSGNYLNYATMSAPDILRLALTGGDRGIDEQTRTVLDRGTIYNGGSAPFRRTLGATVTGLVTPFKNNLALYAYNCSDKVIFTTNLGKGCDNPNVNDATDLSPIIANSTTASGTTTVTPTVPPIQQVGTTWTDTGNRTTTIPTVGPVQVVTYYTTSMALVTTPFSCPAAPCVTESGTAIDISIKQTTYAANGTSTTAASTSLPSSTGLDRTVKGYYWTGATSTTAPIAAAESPAVVRGYARSGSTTTTVTPPTAAESPAVIRGYMWDNTTTTTAPATAEENPTVIRGYVWDNTTSTVAPPTGAEGTPVARGYVWDGTTSTTTPITAAEATPVVRGYVWDGTTSTTAPITAAESPAVVRGTVLQSAGYYVFTHQGGSAPVTTLTATRNHYVCYDTAAPYRIRVGPQSSNPTCAAGQTKFRYTSTTASARNYYLYYENVNFYYDYIPFYRDYVAFYRDYTPFYRKYVPFYYAYAPYYRVYAPFYTNYDRTDYYWTYTSYIKYKVLLEQAVWNSYTATAKAIVKPRALVCDSTEGPTREVVYGAATTDRYYFCTKYEYAGTTGYKPEGQIQKKSEQARVSVFSYLMDDATRYGGVMRAPMKYVGPNKYDDTGNLINNPEKEWNVTTGQFITKPITDSVSTGYTHTGVINYLNRFGKTGNYKTIDNVGELWYESLRYLQGLAPTPEAVSGMTDVMKDGYPVYSTWTDPITSACQRSNYILGIGDTNTHYDKTIPGVTRAEQTLINNSDAALIPPYEFTYTTTPTINGSSVALNSHDWTKIVNAFERNNAAALPYTDSLGRAQTTGGNTSRNTSVGNLDTSGTGSGSRSSYHWAGLAYWANTQPIRKDIKGGASMDQVRVKTFMIDVDENNQTSINAAIKNTSYYIAGKYGYFDDRNQNGNPFSGDTESSNWADSAGAPKGYVLASQPQRLVAGIAQFFNDAGGGGNSFATVAVSSNSLSAASPNGNTFEPSFVPGEWGGTVKSVGLGLNTATNTLVSATTTLWDAGKILTEASRAAGSVTLPQVRPDQRKIITYITSGTPRGVSFTYAATNNGADLPASFNTIPYTTIEDNQAEARVNYLRGDRTKELDESFRPRQNILGDIINSGPVYKAGANLKIAGDDQYAAFVAAKKGRIPMVYTGSNDGMLHAFKAETGQEMFAYIPSGALEKMPNLTSKNYIHQLFVDAVPAVDEVRTSSGWKTVLASGMGGGAQGIFALDVTDPESFNASNVMFEFTDRDDAAIGNVTSQPQFVKMLVPGTTSPAVYKYYLVVASGYNNYKNDGSGRYTLSPDQALFFLDINKGQGVAWAEGTNYYKVILPASDQTKANGMPQPGIRLGSANEAIDFYAGDLQGNIWKISFPKGIDSTKIAAAIRTSSSSKTPLFTAKDAANNAQPITSAPVIRPYSNGGNMIIFGTGRLLETVDRSTTSTQAIYGVWDSGRSNNASYNLTRANLTQLTVNSSTLAITGSTSTFANYTASKRGWYFNLSRTKERIVIDPVTTAGVVEFSSTIPPSSECTDNGNSLVYFVNPATGLLATEVAGGDGYYGKGLIIDIDTSTTVSSYSARSVTGGRTATKKVGILVPGQDGKKILQYFDITYMRTGRIYWREVRDFNLTTQ